MFFFRIFSLKYSRNLLGSKYNLTMVTFNSWTDTLQISAAPNFYHYLILLVPFWKIMSFETKWIAFFGAKSRCYLPRSRSPQKQCVMLTRYSHSKIPRYCLRSEDRAFPLNINTRLYKHFHSPGFVSTLCQLQKGNVAKFWFQ